LGPPAPTPDDSLPSADAPVIHRSLIPDKCPVSNETGHARIPSKFASRHADAV